MLWALLSIVLLGSIYDEFVWVIQLLRETIFPQISIFSLLFFIRLTWAMYSIQYLALAMFVESLENKRPKFKAHNILFGFFGAFIVCYFTYSAFFLSDQFPSDFEKILKKIANFQIFFLFIPPVMSFMRMNKNRQAPHILLTQMRIFIFFIVLPHIFLELITHDPFNLFHDIFPKADHFIATGSFILLTYGIYFCAKKIIGMRFLNVTEQVQGEARFNFITDFKEVLKELGQVTTLNELKHITSSFYKIAFNVPTEKTKLYLRFIDAAEDTRVNTLIEPYLTEPFITNNPILVRDELEFSYFYDEKDEQKEALSFLARINADIFIPVYEKHTITAYIIIERNARPQNLFSKVEYDEMLVFTGYLGALIHLLRNRNLDSLIQQEKELKEELYYKHQELHHCKETIRECLQKHYVGTEAHHIKSRILKDPSNWYYMLFLETTHSGKLINKLIPGTGTQILDFKVNLLKAALSKKAVLLNLPDEDLLPTVELLHHLSLRDHLEEMSLATSEKNHEYAIKLFGINPLFGSRESTGLLEKSDHNGTIFIKNIHLLSVSTQEQLAHFLKTGTFSQVKSDRKRSSSARVICSSNQNVGLLIQQGSFSPNLYHELIKSAATLPSLLTISEEELTDLTAGFIEHIILEKNSPESIDLTSRERQKLIENRPISLQEYKERLYNMLINKAKKRHIKHEEFIDAAYSHSNPDTHNIAKLGKNALKDKQVMTYLWNKFKNQTKIAKLLNVNRSSVNRRCKEFNLIDEHSA